MDLCPNSKAASSSNSVASASSAVDEWAPFSSAPSVGQSSAPVAAPIFVSASPPVAQSRVCRPPSYPLSPIDQVLNDHYLLERSRLNLIHLHHHQHYQEQV
jgi:hypothetical protein